MSVTCQFNGRLGNVIFNMAQVIAYCKKYNLTYRFPNQAWACTNGVVPIQVPATGTQPINPIVYNEPQIDGYPYYHEIPPMDNVEFRGYYQSFKYFEDYRQDVLDAINFPWQFEVGVVGVHIRIGDNIGQEQSFPIAPQEYYTLAIQYMMDRGLTRFRLFSDSMDKVKHLYNSDSYSNTIWEYREGYNEVEDFVNLSGCEGIITARSTFSLMAAWFNRSPDKVVCIPAGHWWKGQNRDLLPDYYNHISFNKLQDIYEH